MATGRARVLIAFRSHNFAALVKFRERDEVF